VGAAKADGMHQSELRRDVSVWGSYMWGYAAVGADIYTALLSGLINQQLANDPGGQRWRRLIPRVIAIFADDLGISRSELARPEPANTEQTRKKDL